MFVGFRHSCLLPVHFAALEVVDELVDDEVLVFELDEESALLTIASSTALLPHAILPNDMTSRNCARHSHHLDSVSFVNLMADNVVQVLK